MNTHIHSLDTHERYTRSFCGYTGDQYTIHSLEAHVINHDTLDPHSFSRATCHAYTFILRIHVRCIHTCTQALEKHAMNTHIHSLETHVSKSFTHSLDTHVMNIHIHSLNIETHVMNTHIHSLNNHEMNTQIHFSSDITNKERET